MHAVLYIFVGFRQVIKLCARYHKVIQYGLTYGIASRVGLRIFSCIVHVIIAYTDVASIVEVSMVIHPDSVNEVFVCMLPEKRALGSGL